ncbi:unnamed protein product, partial [Prorocentrum cordatum]
MAQKRSRCKGSDELEAALINHFKEADELDYPHGLADDCDPDVLSEWEDMLLDVRRAMCPHMAISQSKAIQLFEKVLEENGAAWALGDEEKDWTTSMAKMLRAMLGHVQQAVLKNMKREGRYPDSCAWVQPFVEQMKKLDAAKEPTYTYSVDMVTRRAHRLDQSIANPAPEYAMPLQDDPLAADHDEVIAKFRGGASAVIAGFVYKTIREWKQLDNGGKCQKGSNIIVELVSGTSKFQLSKWTRNGSPEMGIWEFPKQGKKRMIVNFVPHAGMVGHEEMLEKQARLLAAGKTTKEEIEVIKRAFIKKFKDEQKETDTANVCPMRRPAAAAAKKTSSAAKKPKQVVDQGLDDFDGDEDADELADVEGSQDDDQEDASEQADESAGMSNDEKSDHADGRGGKGDEAGTGSRGGKRHKLDSTTIADVKAGMLKRPAAPGTRAAAGDLPRGAADAGPGDVEMEISGSGGGLFGAMSSF